MSIKTQPFGQNIADAIKLLNVGTTPSSLDAEFSTQITPQNIDEMFIRWWGKANNGDYTKTQLLERWFNLLRDEKTYGSKVPLFAHSASPNGEMELDSVALGICTPSTNTTKGKDNFCKQPLFWTVEIEYEIDADGEIEVKTVDKIDLEYTRTGTHGMVGVAQKNAWFSRYSDGSYRHNRYSAVKQSGFKPLPEGVKPNGDLRAFVVHAKYLGGRNASGIPTSATNLAPMIFNISQNSQISEWRKRGVNYSGMSGCDNNFRELMFELKYSNKGNSGIMEGCSSYNYDYTVSVSETQTNRVVVTKELGSNFLIGSWVGIGKHSRSISNVLPVVKIKGKNDITIDGTVYTAIYYDSNIKIDTVAGTTHIATLPWGSGSCDGVLGVDGSPNSNTNGKEPYIIQGLETQNGAWVVFADIISVDTTTSDSFTITPKICRLAKNISTGVTSNYIDGKAITYPYNSANWRYNQDISIDSDEVIIADSVGGSAGSSNGTKSATYHTYSAGSFEWLALGSLDHGGYCGLACAILNNGLGVAGWYVAGGAPGSGANRGEYRA